MLLNLFALQLYRKGIKGKEDGERDGGGGRLSISVKGVRLFEGGHLLRDGYYSGKYRMQVEIVNGLQNMNSKEKCMRCRWVARYVPLPNISLF